jgi:hypothetical protein
MNANGTAQGMITLASTSGFLPGAVCQLYDTAGNNMTVKITVVPNATTLYVRKWAQPFAGPGAGGPQAPGSAGAPVQTLTENLPPNYGNTNVSAFLTANGARICQNAQIVRVEPAAQAAPLL